MCGIAGIIAPDSKKYTNNLKKMLIALKHRGPDDEGVYFFNNCALGHVRLSIVDLSRGKQPMITPNKKMGITFNGEIYGYKDIKKFLSNWHFRTTSDTEVILALYQKYNNKMLGHLPGMFAFAIWDDDKKRLFCARDRFGEKPFYYSWGINNEFIFASEIKAILASGLVKPILNKESLIHYIKHLYVHPHTTIYKNIYTLPPAHCLCFKNNKIEIKRYWRLPPINNKIKLEDAIERFRDLLEKAVAKQLIADVPVGAFLSGGLDSTTIVYLASQYKKNIKTFSFGFKDSISELPFAREVAEKYKTNHIEIYDHKFEISDLILKMQNIYDEPFADSSNIPTFLISKLASKHLKVILSGDGGDELLGGYKGWYKPLYFMQKLKNTSQEKIFFMQLFVNLVRRLKFSNPEYYSFKLQALQKKEKFNSIIEAHLAKNVFFTDQELQSLGLNDFTYKQKFSWTPNNTVDDAMRIDIENYLPGDILVKIDRASMAWGLELRAPFLDVDFASFCLSLPYNLKLTNKTDKFILRQAFSKYWPPTIRKRDKHGFGAPVNKWLKNKSVQELKQEYLNNKNKKIFNIISFNSSQQFIKKDNYQTWILLILSIWMEKNYEQLS